MQFNPKLSQVFLYLEHFLLLLPLAGVNNPGLAVPFRIPNQRGNLAHFLLLKDVGLGAAPGDDGLQGQMMASWVSVWVVFVFLGRVLTSPRSRMKQSPLLKLLQDSATSLARMLRLPLI